MNEPLTLREMIDMHRLLEIEIASSAENLIAGFQAKTGAMVVGLVTTIVAVGKNGGNQIVTCSVEVVR